MRTDIYRALEERDIARFSEALVAAGREDVFFDPLDSRVPNPRNAGSLLGLCVSAGWHDGIRVCRDLGVDPNRNSMVRDPLRWAYSDDDVVALQLLIEMGADPARKRPDDRNWGIDSQNDKLKQGDIAEYAADPRYGALDVDYLRHLLNTNLCMDMRSVFASTTLDNIRPRCGTIFFDWATSREAITSDSRCAYFAQFAYFDAVARARFDVAEILHIRFSLAPDPQVVSLRKGTHVLSETM